MLALSILLSLRKADMPTYWQCEQQCNTLKPGRNWKWFGNHYCIGFLTRQTLKKTFLDPVFCVAISKGTIHGLPRVTSSQPTPAYLEALSPLAYSMPGIPIPLYSDATFFLKTFLGTYLWSDTFFFLIKKTQTLLRQNYAPAESLEHLIQFISPAYKQIDSPLQK